MTEPTTRRAAPPFPEELLTGYLDGVLTQQEEQRVRLHLERSAEARALYSELAAMRAAGRSTPLPGAEDLQWSEAPRTTLSGVARRLGFALIVVSLLLWMLGAAAIAAFDSVNAPIPWLRRSVAFTGFGGFLLLFLSVLADRLRDARTDRYRRVLK